MSSSRLAQHLPSLFGSSRRAAWRLLVVRRLLAAGALLLALHLTLGAARPPATPADRPAASGPALTLPLAAPAEHLEPGDAVGVYLPGQAEPVVTGASVLATPVTSGPVATVRLAMPQAAVGDLVQQMAPDAGGVGFVIVRQG